MKKFYFTFGIGHVLSDYVQVIVADDMETALAKMFELYGENWSIDYPEERWVETEGARTKTELDYVYCVPVMTVGEMFAWTNRFSNIIKVGGDLKNSRLTNLLHDLKTAYSITTLEGEAKKSSNESYEVQLYRAVTESLTV